MTWARYSFYLLVAVLATSAFEFSLSRETPVRGGDLVAIGRRVYVSEGCIHCHSQYVRPVGADQALWGEPTSVERALSQEPVLIGNRRQAPDLANVGQRRSPGWNRLHLMEPSALVPGSRMPSYRHLFEPRNERGEALLVYLSSLQPNSLMTDKTAMEVNDTARNL
ncbi:cbb3-type cytochrome c oxidase subunit II [Coraliomargarita sp. W4R72]